MEKYIRLFKEKLFTREIITYVISGFLTTLVNYAASFILFNLLSVDENVTTIVAWIVAVLFAYIINDIWVFRTNTNNFSLFIKKISTFFGSRLVTLAIEEAAVYIFATKLGIYYWYVKIPVSVIVIILNYLFSKFITFSRRLLGQEQHSHNDNT